MGGQEPRAQDLELGLVGNGSFGALFDARARLVWCCLPAFDGDPAFCDLLQPRIEGGFWDIELEGFARAEQQYDKNTAILRTVLHDGGDGAIEVVDFAPRWRQHGRFYRPVMLARRERVLAGRPRVRVRIRPLADWGARVPEHTWGSNHIRFLLPQMVLRVTTDMPLRALRDEIPVILDRDLHFILGPDETLTRPVDQFVREAEQRTRRYWHEWVRYLSIPAEWQEAVIRSAIVLKLCQYEDSGGIIAALTTSIPDAPGTQRNWDYR
jgi:GH15 family glucan-1,4-alpha-glucosidase